MAGRTETAGTETDDSQAATRVVRKRVFDWLTSFAR